ncbi:hypothetical protein CC80DRAFT_500930 [Byssothecium circinans]|uniref:Uncharacterized protein n=1 Tax=Byssothecium circinans TaxID=147558 RepID=A0A6A5U670_9PLEO|nr:hypothetical protein CC80DRAFT_500930 [Byssothecium circinans]
MGPPVSPSAFMGPLMLEDGSISQHTPPPLSLTPQVHISIAPSSPPTATTPTYPDPHPSISPTLQLIVPPPLTTHPYHGFPAFRLQLTLYYTSSLHLLVRANTTMIKKTYLSGHLANAAAIDLARCCCSEGEIVMLMHQTRLCNGAQKTDWMLNDYWVGKWDEHNAIVRDSVFLSTVVQGYMVQRVRGKVTGRVKVLYEGGNF